MTLKYFAGLSLISLALSFASAASATGDQHNLSVRNDTGGIIGCGIRRAGSSAIDDVTLRSGQVWSWAYAGSKARLIRCEGELSNWQPLEPERSYALVRRNADRIDAQPLSPR